MTTKWKDMTDAEKGALLLAHLEGKVIESYNETFGIWCIAGEPKWRNDTAYRICMKPLPEREFVQLNWGYNSKVATHIISFEINDGKVLCETIRMEPK